MIAGVTVDVVSSPFRVTAGNVNEPGLVRLSRPVLQGATNASIVPFAPTENPRPGFTNERPLSCWAVPEVCAPQVVPPSVVARIVPAAPTAQQSTPV